MSENYGVVQANPYGVAPAASGLADQQRHSSGNVLAANAEAVVTYEVKAQVIIAKEYPRDRRVSVDEILKECARPDFADAAVYSYPRGKEMVTGPSIRLAEQMANAWGNNKFGWEMLDRKRGENGRGYSVVRCSAWDLEKNVFINRQFTVEHWRQTKSGGYALTDDRDIYELEANMAARRLRACILQMIPGEVTAVAVNACRKTSSTGLAKAMEDPRQRSVIITQTAKVYEKMGIKQNDLEEFLNTRVDDWNADHMLRLKELKNSLDDGISNIAEVFPHLASGGANSLITKEQVKELMELASATGRQGDISDVLKKAGIAKYADIPADKYADFKRVIENMIPKTNIAAPEATTAANPTNGAKPAPTGTK